jgi:hypothetical protein
MHEHEYTFDVRLSATVRVRAATEAKAHGKLREQHSTIHVGIDDGEQGIQILEAFMEDGEPDLVAVDGDVEG